MVSGKQKEQHDVWKTKGQKISTYGGVVVVWVSCLFIPIYYYGSKMFILKYFLELAAPKLSLQ